MWRSASLLLGCLAFSAPVMGKPARSPACEDLCQQIDACVKRTGEAGLGPLLCEMARCETGDKCRKQIRSPSGRYHGPFQFLAATWRKVCLPIFKEKRIQGCSGKGAYSDPCCATVCAAEIIASGKNGGLANWPTCGKRAKRAVAAQAKEKSKQETEQ